MRYTINKILILESVVARPQMSTVDKVQTGTVGAIGAGSWAYRNWNNKKRQYV